MLFLDVLQKVIRDYAYKPRVAISEDTDQLSRGEILVRNAADIKGHIVSTLEDIYGHTFEIAISVACHIPRSWKILIYRFFSTGSQS